VDETYVKVAGRWRYLYRAVDQYRQVIDVLLAEQRDTAAARWFFTRALAAGPGQSNTTAATGPMPAKADAGSWPTEPRWLTTQSSLPSGSAITTHETAPWPMSSRGSWPCCAEASFGGSTTTSSDSSITIGHLNAADPKPGQVRRVGGSHHDLHETGGHPQGLPQCGVSRADPAARPRPCSGSPGGQP